MRPIPFCCLTSLLAGSALASPTVLSTASLGGAWSGPRYQDTLGWSLQAADVDGDGRGDLFCTAPQGDGPPSFDSTLRLYLDRDGLPGPGRADWQDMSFTDTAAGGDEVFDFTWGRDLDGDDAPDLVVTQPNHGDAGRVLVIPGGGWGAALTDTDATIRLLGTIVTDPGPLTPYARPSATRAADLDDDGRAELIVLSAVRRLIWRVLPTAGDTALSLDDAVGLCGDQLVASEFAAAAAIGDWNDDDVDDLAVSAPGCDGGRVFVWYGGPLFSLAVPSQTLIGGARPGVALHSADLDGDGVDDLFVAEDGAGASAGRGGLRIHRGGGAGLAADPDVVIAPGFLDGHLGAAVAVLPDLSQPPDGIPDLAVGSPDGAATEQGEGAVFLFEGTTPWPASLTSDDARYAFYGSHGGARLGSALAAVDDLDGDGHAELAVGEPEYTDGDAENNARRGKLLLITAFPERDDDGDGVSTLAGDCDDRDADTGPNRVEQCFDERDNDCDGAVDEYCDEGDDDDDVTDDDDSADAPEEVGCAGCGGQATLGFWLIAPLLFGQSTRARRTAYTPVDSAITRRSAS